MELTRTPSEAKRFWAVADYFRKVGPPWSPATAGYELWRTVEVGDSLWSVCMKVHAAPARNGPRAPLRFKASVTLWPNGAGHDRRGQASMPAWSVKVQRHLGRFGYQGRWMTSPGGVFGDFWKDLGGLAAVRREAKLLAGLEFPTATPKATGKSRRWKGA